MKASLIILLITTSIGFATAQSANDPTYSIHNYKHPNKAKEASLHKHEGNNNIAYQQERTTAARNYKAFAHPNSMSGAVMTEAQIQTDSPSVASNGNYKSVFGKKKEAVPAKNTGSGEAPIVKEKQEADKKNH